jgi:hypothetical protein
MGVAYSVCSYNLVNEVFKEAVQQIIQKTAEKMSQ